MHATQAAEIPSIGCAADGQTGPLPAPESGVKSIAIDEKSAKHLAYHYSQDSAPVLGPRGWKCFAYYGSSGSTILVARDVAPAWGTKHVEGPAIVPTMYFADTSGAFGVAPYLARLYPKEGRKFIQDELVEIRGTTDLNYSYRPYPTDKLDYIAWHRVAFTTPAHRIGFGTMEFLTPSSLPVSGIVDYRAPAALMFILAMKLPPALSGLKPAILKQLKVGIDASLSKG